MAVENIIKEIAGIANEANRRLNANKSVGENGIFNKAFRMLEKNESTKFLAPGDEVKQKVFQQTEHITKNNVADIMGAQDLQYKQMGQAVNDSLGDIKLTTPDGSMIDLSHEQAKKLMEQYEKVRPHQSTIMDEITNDGGYMRSQNINEKINSYFSHEAYGGKRKIAAGVGIGAVALGGLALTRDEDSSGALGAVLGGAGAAGMIGYGISKM